MSTPPACGASRLRTAVLLCLLVLPSVLCAQSLTVAWDHSPDAAAIGYTVYVGTQPGSYNVASFDVGKVTSTIWNAPGPGTYYIAVKSYDINGNRGALSNEVSATLAAPPPPESCNPDGTGNGVDEDQDGQTDEICLPPPPSPPPPSDTLAPVVNSLRATRNGNSSNFSVVATASDNVGVAYVDFYVDTFFRARIEVPPYSATLRIQQSGLHVIEARAVDAAQNMSSATVTVKR